MKPIVLIAVAAVCLGAVAAVVLFQADRETDAARTKTLDFFDSERPPTHGGQEMKPRWGG